MELGYIMAILVKNIEREFLLTAAMREKAAIVMVTGGGEWTVRISAVDRDRLTFSHAVPLALLQKGKILDFRYNVRGQTIAFKAQILEPGEKAIVTSIPGALYKNLLRRFARMSPPPDFGVSFSFSGERYDLDFPQSHAYVAPDGDYLDPSFDPADLRALMAEFERKAERVALERGIIMYKDRKPEGAIESLAAATGRAFFLPSSMAGIPISDPSS